jgi:hypothetical protein
MKQNKRGETREQKDISLKRRIELEEDFINCPKSDNSLKTLMEQHPDGISNSRIAKVLMIEESEVEKLYLSALKKLKEELTKGM